MDVVIPPRLRQLREEAKESPSDLAVVLGCSEKVYLKYESGEKELGSGELIKLWEHYGVSTDYIVGLTDER